MYNFATTSVKPYVELAQTFTTTMEKVAGANIAAMNSIAKAYMDAYSITCNSCYKVAEEAHNNASKATPSTK